MSIIGTNIFTMADWATLKDKDGKTPEIVEMLKQTNDILEDALWLEANQTTGHQTSVRTGLPAPTWRNYNQGVANSKSTYAKLVETMAMAEARSAVDQKLAELESDVSAFRLAESAGHLQGMGQEVASTLFYGNSNTASAEFTGLAARYSALGQNCISGAGASDGDETSVWILKWDRQALHGIFPKGSIAGIEQDDLGLGDEDDASGNPFRAYKNLYRWTGGIALRDWRYCARIANIDTTNLVAESSAADIIKLIVKAIWRIPGGLSGLAGGKAAIYMNQTVASMLDIQALVQLRSFGLSYAEIAGKPVWSVRGIPIRICDSILNTEDHLV